jgi:hypothetical protein
VCEASFDNRTLRAMHEKEEHSHWYELNIKSSKLSWTP